jgi:hypothetical protein
MRESGTSRISSRTAMTPALTPARALDYLRELSADIRDGAVLGADGELLAGPEALAAPARELLAAAGEDTDIHVTTGDGAVFLARDERHVIVLACGRLALPSLARYDLRMVLADLRERQEDPATGSREEAA